LFLLLHLLYMKFAANFPSSLCGGCDIPKWLRLASNVYEPLPSEEEHPESEGESQHELPESESVLSVQVEELSSEEAEPKRLSTTAPTINPVV
jgi:hypothetical protein